MRRGRGRGIYWNGRWPGRGYFRNITPWSRGGFPYGRGLGYGYRRAGYTVPFYPGRWWTSPGYGYRPPYAWSYSSYSYPRATYLGYGYW